MLATTGVFAVFIGIKPLDEGLPAFTGGIEQHCTNLGTAKDAAWCVGSEPVSTDEGTISSNFDSTQSPTATELWGDRNGANANFSEGGTSLFKAVEWGEIQWAMNSDGTLHPSGTGIRTGALAITDEQRICWRIYSQYSNDYSTVGSTATSSGDEVVGTHCPHDDTPGGNPAQEWVWDSSTTLRDVSDDRCASGSDWNSDGGTPLKIIGPTSGTVYANMTDCTFSSPDSVITFTVTEGTLQNEAYTFVGRGCDNCPRNKHGFMYWGTGSGIDVQMEEASNSVCPAEGSHKTFNMSVNSGPAAGNYGVSLGPGDCKTFPCRLEMCAMGDLAVGSSVRLWYRVTKMAQGSGGYLTASTTSNNGTAYVNWGGGPGSNEPHGFRINHSNGDIYQRTGDYTVGMVIETRYSTDAGQWPGPALEVEGPGSQP
jgi:hypothetical protein